VNLERMRWYLHDLDPTYLFVNLAGYRVYSKARPGNFPYQLVQDAGPANALGRVKFMFPNSHSVYLHDTPARQLFAKSERAFSSGCIRVENPLEPATLLLEDQSGWNRAPIEDAVAKGKTRTVKLSNPLPVLLTYFTAWVDRNGTLQLRRDVYGRDEEVWRGLEAEFHVRP
jgi:murein L,D-transpeptidase YcbB/YkuD